MTIALKYELVTDFPKLGWLAHYDTDEKVIQIQHGVSVECRDQWMVEGVWDGDFEAGGFHRSEKFFGSGIRIEGGALTLLRLRQ